jgi:hypothetical protein
VNVHLTFDIEVWCNDWKRLDERFPAAFQRYVFGRSPQGDYALPKTLEMLDRHSLAAVFFVEPLFAARFGLEHLATIVELIRDAGQDVQLHLHPEWVDELAEPPIENHHTKRQHLCFYTQDEQRALIAFGAQLLQRAGALRPTAFRAGSFACNRATFAALRDNNILIDSSLNECTDVSGADLRAEGVHAMTGSIEGVHSVPVSVFVDGLGRRRSAQVNGSGYSELVGAMDAAERAGDTEFVIVSHNFEMLKPGSNEPDPVVVRRFESLCKYLSGHRGRLPTCRFLPPVEPAEARKPRAQTRVSLGSTAARHIQQLWRRF